VQKAAPWCMWLAASVSLWRPRFITLPTEWFSQKVDRIL